MISDQRMQLRHPADPFRQLAPDQHPALLVLEFDVVMGLGPVIAQEQHSGLLSPLTIIVPRRTAAP